MNLVLIALIALAGAIQAQPQQPASIEGIVVKLGTGEPLADASVQLNLEIPEERRFEIPQRQQPRRQARTDSNGRFIFDNVVPGEYRLIATYDGGYVPAEYGQRAATGQGIPFAINAGQKVTG